MRPLRLQTVTVAVRRPHGAIILSQHRSGNGDNNQCCAERYHFRHGRLSHSVAVGAAARLPPPGKSVCRGMQRRGFAADPRAIAATEAEVLSIALKLRIVVPVPSVIGSAKTVSMMGQGVMVGDTGLWRQPLRLPGPIGPPPSSPAAKAGLATAAASNSAALIILNFDIWFPPHSSRGNPVSAKVFRNRSLNSTLETSTGRD
jgi:hypothetical protein